jgi:hypothetical protein
MDCARDFDESLRLEASTLNWFLRASRGMFPPIQAP